MPTCCIVTLLATICSLWAAVDGFSMVKFFASIGHKFCNYATARVVNDAFKKELVMSIAKDYEPRKVMKMLRNLSRRSYHVVYPTRDSGLLARDFSAHVTTFLCKILTHPEADIRNLWMVMTVALNYDLHF